MATNNQRLQYGTYYSSQPTGGGSKKTRLLIVGLIFALLIGIGLTAFNLFSGSSRNDLTLLAVRENSLLNLANESQKSIRNADLSVANSNATVLLTSDVTTIIADTGIKKLPEDLVKKEVDTNAETLKQASLLSKFDSTYRALVLEKVRALLSQAQTVRAAVSSKKDRDLVDKVLVNLQSIEKQFTDLNL